NIYSVQINSGNEEREEKNHKRAEIGTYGSEGGGFRFPTAFNRPCYHASNGDRGHGQTNRLLWGLEIR
ncbi:MAG TPA: hypothetical protein VFC44_12325, partial [Candidatus Saccharimonadales bacterium]|nr:hypothetical protein [Candidatus Saccharimonadales bacterium]